MFRTTPILKALVVGLAAAATLAPAALADPPALWGVQSAGPDAVDRQLASVQTTDALDRFLANDRDRAALPVARADGPDGRVVPTSVPIASTGSGVDDGFSWSALGMGIGLGLALAALVAAAAVLGRRRVVHA